MRRLTLMVAMVLFVTVIPLGAAGATGPPEPITLEGPSFFGDPGNGFFTATGPICPAGSFVDIGGFPAPSHPVEPGFNIKIIREFTCSDGEMFQMKLEVRVDNRRGAAFNWLLLGGTGPYADLHANGTGYGAAPIFEDGVLIGIYDVYEGKAH